MEFFQINQKKKIMIILGMLLLKTVVVDKVDLGASVDQIFQIFLKIFLVILVVEVEEVLEEKTLTTEVLT